MKYRLGPDRAIRVAQHLSVLGPEAIRHLVQDPSLESNIVAEGDMVGSAFSTFTTPAIVIPTQDQNIRVSSQSANTGIKQSHSRRHPNLARSKSDVSSPSKPDKIHVRCRRMECAQHPPFKSLRGLREHFVLKHDMSIDQASHEAESAFKLGNGTLLQPQHLEPPGGLFATARTQVQNDEARSMTPRLSSVIATEQAPFRMSMSPNNAVGQLPGILPRAQQFALQDYRNSFRPHIEASTTSSFHTDQGFMSSDNLAVDMPANIRPNYHNHWNGNLLQSPGQQCPRTPPIELRSDIDAPQYSSLDGSHSFPPGWQ